MTSRRELLKGIGASATGVSLLSGQASAAGEDTEHEIDELNPEWEYHEDENRLDVKYDTSDIFFAAETEPQDFNTAEELGVQDKVIDEMAPTGANVVQRAVFNADFIEKLPYDMEVDRILVEGRGLNGSQMQTNLEYDWEGRVSNQEAETLFREHSDATSVAGNYDHKKLLEAGDEFTYSLGDAEHTFELVGVTEDEREAYIRVDNKAYMAEIGDNVGPAGTMTVDMIQPSSYAEKDHIEIISSVADVEYHPEN